VAYHHHQQREIFAAYMLAASISTTSQLYDDYVWRAAMRPHVLGIESTILSEDFTSTLTSDAILSFERVCSDCGVIFNSRDLATAAIQAEESRFPPSSIEESILVKINLCICTRKSGQYDSAKSTLEQQLLRLQKAKLNPDIYERLLARVR